VESTEDLPFRAYAPGNAVPTLPGSNSAGEIRTLDFEKEEFLELLKQVASIARIGVWELNLETMQPVWSPEVYRIHELTEGETLTLEQAISYYAPEGREDIESAVNRGIKFGIPWDLTLPIFTAKGRKLWVRVLGSPESHGGKCVRLFGTIQDITDQRRAEQERLEIERQLIRSQKMEAIGTVAGEWHTNS
jgi:PAS domain S-box-containing protein